jgi:cytochrome c553
MVAGLPKDRSIWRSLAGLVVVVAQSCDMGWFVRLPNRQSYFAAAMATLFCLSSHVGSASAQTSNPPAIVEVCAPCHGINGTGGDVEKPNLAGQKSIYFREQLLAFRSGKRKHPDMKPIARDLSDREIDQLVIYYSTLSPN